MSFPDHTLMKLFAVSIILSTCISSSVRSQQTPGLLRTLAGKDQSQDTVDGSNKSSATEWVFVVGVIMKRADELANQGCFRDSLEVGRLGLQLAVAKCCAECNFWELMAVHAQREIDYGNFKDASELLQVALQLTTDNHDASQLEGFAIRSNYGLCLRELGQIDDAIHIYDGIFAEELDGISAESRVMLSCNYARALCRAEKSSAVDRRLAVVQPLILDEGQRHSSQVLVAVNITRIELLLHQDEVPQAWSIAEKMVVNEPDERPTTLLQHAKTLEVCAQAALANKQTASAISYLKIARRIRRRMLGFESPLTRQLDEKIRQLEERPIDNQG